MRGELIRERLHRGQRVYGTAITNLTNPYTAQMAVSMELDFIFVCNEHMPLDHNETGMICRFYAAHGISPIVRVPCPMAHYASKALDNGAQGIVVPYVETVEQVREIVGAVKYRPIKGRFLADILSGQRKPEPKTVAFLNEYNRDTYVIIGIESVEAYNHLDELMGVDGVDGVFLGPHDLTVSLEIPTEYENPLFVDLVEDVIRRAIAAGKGVGAHIQMTYLKPATYKRLLDAGMNWIVNGSDISAMCDEASRQLRELRAMCGDTFTPDGKGTPAPQGCIRPGN